MHMCTTIYTIHTQKYKTHATTLPLSSSKSSRRKLSLKETTNALSKQFNSNVIIQRGISWGKASR